MVWYQVCTDEIAFIQLVMHDSISMFHNHVYFCSLWDALIILLANRDIRATAVSGRSILHSVLATKQGRESNSESAVWLVCVSGGFRWYTIPTP